jgi:iron complex transport system ATP-binding protein
MTNLNVDRLSVGIAGRTFCRDLTLRMRAGETWAILGANGSGKTTLLHTLAGLRAQQAGTVRIDGHDVQEMNGRTRARLVALLTQHQVIPPATRVLDTVLIGRHPYLPAWASEGPEDRAQALAALSAVHLTGFEHRELTTLSGGERRRVAIATLLAQSTPIRLLDEPVNHLDLGQQIRVLHLLTQAPRPALNILVLHDINLAARFCTHGLFLLEDGEHRHGHLSSLLDPALLSRLYACDIEEFHTERRRIFLPA